MAFDLQKLENHSSSGNGPRLFTYNAGSDTKAQVEAANYFNNASSILTVGSIILSLTAGGVVTSRVSANAAGVVTIVPAGVLTGSATYDAASIVDGGTTTTTIAVIGAVLGDFAQVSFGVSLAGMAMTCYVSAADTVTVVLNNESGGAVDLASTTIRARVTPF